MRAPLLLPWSQDAFFAWAGSREGRCEFDGFRPVAMTGGTITHAIILRNLHRALDARLRGGRCQPLGPDAGVATTGNAIRYPDGLVTCGGLGGNAVTVPDVVVLFEILSPCSGCTDRIIKVREYAAIPSARRYVIIESGSIGLMVLERGGPDARWLATTLTAGDVLRMPEIGCEMAIEEIYQDVAFDGEATA